MSGQVFEGGLQHQREQQGSQRVSLAHACAAQHWRFVRVRPRNPELAEVTVQVPGHHLPRHLIARECIGQVHLESEYALITMHICAHGMSQRLAAAADAYPQLMGGERRADRRHLGECTEASQPQPHSSDCDRPYGPWAAWLGQSNEAAVEQRVTPRKGATEQQVDELHAQLQRAITAFEGGHHVLVCGAAGPGGGA